MTTNRFRAGDRVRIVGDAVEEFLGQTGTVLAEEDRPFEIVGDFPVYRVHMDDDDAKFYYWREDFLAAEDISAVIERINERLDALEYAIWGDLDAVEEDLDAEAYGEEVEEVEEVEVEIGDKVRVTGDTGEARHGFVGLVTDYEAEFDVYRVEDDDRSGWWVYPAELEVVSKATGDEFTTPAPFPEDTVPTNRTFHYFIPDEPALVARLESAIARLEDLNNYGQEA